MTDPSPKLRRRFLRFSLRAMLLLILVVAVVLGWEMNKIRQQRLVVAALKAAGCRVLYRDPGASSIHIVLSKLLGEEGSRNENGVDGSSSQITDAGMADLQGLPHLLLLNLDKTHVTDAGLIHIRGLKELGWLNLSGTAVTDSGLEQLRELRIQD